MSSRVVGEAFGAYTAAAVEGMELEMRREYNECDFCDLTLYGRCHARAWGGAKLPPTHVDQIVENRPWTCNRDAGHEHPHVACQDGRHEVHTWGDSECLSVGKCKVITHKLLVEAASTPLPGKFVRRPQLEELINSQVHPDQPIPVDREEPRPEGGVTLFIMAEHRIMGVDVTEEFAENLPVLYLAEGDLMGKKPREHGEKFLEAIADVSRWNDDAYQMIFFTAAMLADIKPTPGGITERMLNKLGEGLLEYEKRHFMAS